MAAATRKVPHLLAGEPIAVISGGDAQQSYRAKTSRNAITTALSGLGYLPLTLELGPTADADLLASGARIAVNAALDCRLDDGAVQELCDALGIACVGAPASAFRATGDKAACSARLAESGIATPRQKVVSRGNTYTLGVRASLPRIAAQLGPRVVIKPRHGSAGLGVRTVEDIEVVPAAVLSAFNYDEAVVIESAISGREYTVLVSGGKELWAVGIAEVLYSDFDSSAAGWGRTYEAVSEVTAARLQSATETARAAAAALGCTGLATVDLIVDENGNEWVIDVDCMIDWSPDSRLAACLATNHLSEQELLASLLDQGAPPVRLAAA
jgi:D-alanine-D-alanine ligase